MAVYPLTAYTLCNALGPDLPTVAAALRDGVRGVRARTYGIGERTYVCGLVDDQHLQPLAPSHAAYDTRQARLTAATYRPIADRVDAARRRWGSNRLAVIVGTSTGGIGATEGAYAEHVRSGDVPSSFDLARHHAMQATVDLLVRQSGAKGPAFAISTACSSSGKALGAAQRLLDAGLCDAALVGGIDSLCDMTLRGFSSLEVMSPEPCRPFSAERTGINLGEGGALLLVERQGSAAVQLVAVGESSDAHHMSAPHPEGLGAKLAMTRALERGGVEPKRVSYVNVHGTATELNDAAEAKAIAELFGPKKLVVATKGYTGHLLGAAGATEAVLAALSIAEGWVPASLGCDPVDPSLDVGLTRTWAFMESDFVLSNSFAFGGSNVSVLLGARDQ